jgi:hypothetical protein
MSTTTTRPNTPGYNCHLFITLTTDKNGRPVAHYWARGRFFRCSAVGAKQWIAQGLATEV